MKVAFQATPMDVRGMLGKVWGSLIVCMPSNGGVMLRPGCSRLKNTLNVGWRERTYVEKGQRCIDSSLD